MTQTPSPYEGAPAAQNLDAVDSGDRYRPDDTSQSSMKDSTTESSKNTVATEAGKVAETGVQAAKDVAGTAKQEASNVVAETKQQARSLFESVRDEVAAQGGTQQQRLAASLHSISEELGGLAAGSQQPGPVTDLVEQAARKSGEFAEWLEGHEPADLLKEVQSFARRRPVAFLALCGLAGVIAGRIARGAAAANTELDSGSNDRGLPRLADVNASTDGAGAGYSDLLASPEVGAGDSLGTRFDDPARAAYDAGLGSAAADDPADGGLSIRTGEVR